MRLTSLFAAVAMMSASSIVLAQPAARDLSLPQLLVQSVEVAKPNELNVSVSLDQKDATYELGEPVHISVSANKPAFFEVVAIGPTGNAIQLYPNQLQASEKIDVGEVLMIPGDGGQVQILATAPAGLELIRVIASTTPLAELPAASLTGPFSVIAGGAETVARDLQQQVVAEAGELAFADTLLWTSVPEVTETGDVMEDLSIPLTTDNLDPLPAPPAPLLALDRSEYPVGERLRMAVTSLADCYLWVVNVSADGSARLLFPNRLVRQNRAREGQTIIVSGSPSPTDVVALGPEGPETIYALCGRDASPPWHAGIDFGEAFPSVSTEEGIGRALAARAEELAESMAGYGIATATISVVAEE